MEGLPQGDLELDLELQAPPPPPHPFLNVTDVVVYPTFPKAQVNKLTSQPRFP